MKVYRREFGKLAFAGAIGLTTGLASSNGKTMSEKGADRLSVHLFSKHLQFLNYKDMAEVTAEMGFDGVDLTVRVKGHVEPERAVDDLPKAAEAIKGADLKPNMLVSGITSVSDGTSIQSLKTAAQLGFKHYRMGYFRPKKGQSMQEILFQCNDGLDELEKFNRSQGLHGAYQNHAGQVVGSFVTDLAHLLEGRDARWLGCQYDIRHATVDGGSSWPLGLSYLKDHIWTMPIKDFNWVKTNGKWKPKNVPLGEGMVDFDGYFKELRSYGIRPLVSLHLEYELGGAEHGNRKIKIPQKKVFAAMKRDLNRLHDMWEKSEG